MNAANVPPMIVMGVSGSGKSTIGALLGERLHVPFIDGDDVHPEANKAKMAAGHPLTDEDRWPWLHRIGELIDAGMVEGHPTIVACSALKRVYRDLLRGHAPQLIFVHLSGGKDTIADRIAGRAHEYMPATLLDSQLSTLEPLGTDEARVLVDLDQTPDQMVDQILRDLPLQAAC
jgi:gluconokinase